METQQSMMEKLLAKAQEDTDFRERLVAGPRATYGGRLHHQRHRMRYCRRVETSEYELCVQYSVTR